MVDTFFDVVGVLRRDRLHHIGISLFHRLYHEPDSLDFGIEKFQLNIWLLLGIDHCGVIIQTMTGSFALGVVFANPGPC